MTGEELVSLCCKKDKIELLACKASKLRHTHAQNLPQECVHLKAEVTLNVPCDLQVCNPKEKWTRQDMMFLPVSLKCESVCVFQRHQDTAALLVNTKKLCERTKTFTVFLLL